VQVHGHIDRCDAEFIEGWVYDADRPDQRISLQIFAAGTPIGECTADMFRQDLADAKLGDGNIAFSFRVPDFLPRTATEEVQLRILGSEVYMLPKTPDAALAEKKKESPTHSSFGGMWIDRADWMDRLAFKHRAGEIDDDMALQIFRFVRDGYLVIPAAVPMRLVAALNDDIDRVWTRPPDGLLIETFEPDDKMKYIAPDLRFRSGRTKLLDLYTVSDIARRVTAAPAPMRFLATIFADTPKAFQQLALWRGAQQPMQKDTAYVKVDTNALQLAATWLALEDVVSGTGELEYFVGSHRAPDFLFGGVSKWMENFTADHERFLASLHEDAETYGHRRASFHGRAGDLLIWHADLAHGSAPITRPNASRRSLLTHFTSASDEPFYRRTAQHQEMRLDNCVFVSQYSDVT
jgi:hypothetical protein